MRHVLLVFSLIFAQYVLGQSSLNGWNRIELHGNIYCGAGSYYTNQPNVSRRIGNISSFEEAKEQLKEMENSSDFENPIIVSKTLFTIAFTTNFPMEHTHGCVCCHLGGVYTCNVLLDCCLNG